MTREEWCEIAGGFVLLICLGLAAIGWVMNLVAIAHWSQGVGMLVLRVIGIFLAPIGAVLGYVT